MRLSKIEIADSRKATINLFFFGESPCYPLCNLLNVKASMDYAYASDFSFVLLFLGLGL